MRTTLVTLFPLILAQSALALPPQPRYLPLDAGNQWTYFISSGPGAGIRLTSKTRMLVIGPENGLHRLYFDGREFRVGGTSDSLDIEVQGEGLVPWYRFQEQSFVHRDLPGCNDRTTYTVASRNDDVATPSRTYHGCLRLEMTGSSCTDAGRIVEWWAPEVGLVQWTDSTIAGPRTHTLEEFEPGGFRPFLRGDGDGDQTLNLTDAVFILSWIFLGGTPPECPDRTDADDNGSVELTDAVVLLNYLFLGGPEPPAPGARALGFDPTATDPFTCGDPPPSLTCEDRSDSDFSGVEISLAGNLCVMTVAQARTGIQFTYLVRISEEHPETVSLALDAGRCETADESGLVTHVEISGGGQLYCLCDVGLCPPRVNEHDLKPGTWESRYPWEGVNWTGPSDTSNPHGPAFPPGDYTITVRSEGMYPSAGGDRTFQVTASHTFHLVP